MLLYPPMAQLVEKTGSRYLLVNLVARRAREISQMEEESGESSDKKAVSVAVDEVFTGKLGFKDGVNPLNEAGKSDED